MVAKRVAQEIPRNKCYLLAKIHMVAKHTFFVSDFITSYLLAKIHMVAKLGHQQTAELLRYLLAKIHMVAKHPSGK